jgi:hypothetical protein
MRRKAAMTTFKMRLIEKFPEFDNSWPDEDRLTWFEQFGRLMVFVLKKDPEKTGMAHADIRSGDRGYTKLI